MKDTGPVYDGYESLTISSTAVILTAATYGTKGFARVTVESNPIRVRLDGTAPTATEGDLLNPGDVLYLDNPSQIKNFKAIRQIAADATIRVHYGD